MASNSRVYLSFLRQFHDIISVAIFAALQIAPAKRPAPWYTPYPEKRQLKQVSASGRVGSESSRREGIALRPHNSEPSDDEQAAATVVVPLIIAGHPGRCCG